MSGYEIYFFCKIFLYNKFSAVSTRRQFAEIRKKLHYEN